MCGEGQPSSSVLILLLKQTRFMFLDIVLLIVGLALILFGANILTDGSAALAQRFKISEFVIGLTIVAIGTSMPELVVSSMSAFNGNSDVAIGNIVGSNIFNTFAILGITALIAPVGLTKSNIRIDIPIGIFAAMVLLIMVSDSFLGDAEFDIISRSEGIFLLMFFVFFMVYSFMSAKNMPENTDSAESQTVKKNGWLITAMIIGGLCGLIFGGNLFLNSGISIARAAGIKEATIAITLMAGGTSLPELAASTVSAIKGKSQLALGNVVGSNISNIFLVLGTSAIISPLTLGDIMPADMLILLGTSILLLGTAYTFKKKQIDRIEGGIFILLFIAYMTWVINR